MAKANSKKTVRVTYVKANGIRCPWCPATLVAAPGKKPAKILAIHIRRKHAT